MHLAASVASIRVAKDKDEFIKSMAHDTQLDRRVAVKIPRKGQLDASESEQFIREARAAAQLKHPNIVAVHEVGREDGQVYIVSDYVEGLTLADWLAGQQLTSRTAAQLCVELAEALHHAHEAGVIHRDLKPTNIIIDGENEPHIMDFGLAKREAGEVTMTMEGKVLGTPAYMSPEQAKGEAHRADRRSDVYSLGVILYELLTGHKPFRGNVRMLLQQVINEDAPSPRRLNGSIPRDLDTLCLKCLEKDPRKRYSTAGTLAEELHRFLRGEPIEARPITAPDRVWRWCKRNTVMASLGSTLALVLLMFAVIGPAIAIKQTLLARQNRLLAKNEAAAREKEATARAAAEEERMTAERQLYAANMNLVQQAWERNNVGRVRELLEEVAAYPERGFEWYYWQRQTRLELRTLTGHLERVDAVAFSPDDRKIVSAGGDRVIRIWDTITGQELQSLRGHIGLIFSVAFSPDGQRLVSGSWDHTAKVWDVASGQMVLSIEGHRSAVTSVAFSANGLIATGSSGGTAVVWDAADATKELEIKGQNLNWHVDLSRDGQRLVTSSRDGKIMIWEVPSGRELSSFETPTSRPLAVKFSPDGDRLVTTHADATIKMWNVAGGKELFSARGHAAGRIFAVAFSPNGQRIVTGSDDHTARVWDAETGRELLTLRGHASGVRAVDFSMDGRIVTASGDKTLKVWDANGASDGLSIVGHTAPIRSVAFSPNGQRIVIGSEDQTATVWATQSGRRELLLPGHKDWISSVVFSTDGQRIATGSVDRTAKVWSAATGSELLTLEGHKAAVLSVAFSPDDQRIVTGSWDHSAIVWDVSSGAPSMSLDGHTGPIWSVAFSPDGQQIVTGSEDRTVRIWDASNGDRLFTLEHHTAPVRSVAYSDDGQRIVTGSVDGTATIWDAFTGTVGQVMRGHNGPIVSATFSANGRRVVTGSGDQTVRVWDTFNGRELLTLSDPTTDVLSATFSRDGRWILGGLADQTARLWEAMSPERLAAFQQEEHTAIEHLAVRQRKAAAAAQKERERRARDPGAVKKWLILAPIRLSADPNNFATLLAEVMEQVQIPADAVEFRPKEGDRVEFGDRQLIWQAALLDDYVIEFDTLLGEGSHWPACVGYAVSYIYSETQQRGLQMRIGCDTFAKVYLNGSEVYRSEQSPWTRDAAMVPDVRLDSGRNVLLLKVANSIGPWRASIRFTDVTGNPVKGIRVTLDPDTKDSL